ncbi:MAG TPA: ion transporter [Gallionellaceae bacterium]|nr:ion transporter [Gallionellaceae bacterium]
MNPHSLKHRLHHILYGQHTNDRWVDAFNIALTALILLNVAAMMLETVEPLYREWLHFFSAFELVSVGLFALEYLIRLWVSDLTPAYQAPFGRLRYLFSPMALIDLAAILPSLLFIGRLDLRFLRVVRLFRIVRLLHLPHCNSAMHDIWQAARSKRSEFLIAGAIMFTLLIISSSLMYFAEHDAQPVAFSSIPAALWWGIITLTTVGYGDVYPVTIAGKMIAAFFAALGIGFFALPSAILASALIEQSRRKETRCPHCGKSLRD